MGLKSLRMAGARRAIRDLFRRTPPVDANVNDSPPATATTLTTSTTSENHKASSLSLRLTEREQEQEQEQEQVKDQQHEYEQTQEQKQEEEKNQEIDSGQGEKKSHHLPPTTTDRGGSSIMAPTTLLDHHDHGNKPQPQLQDQSRRPRQYSDEDKENKPPSDAVESINKRIDALKLDQRNDLPTKLSQDEPEAQDDLPDMSMFNDPVIMAERATHLGFINQALNMARLALKTNETPVGCVLVHNGKVIARGMNATNVTRNGTRHAEYMALSALLSYPPLDAPAASSASVKSGKSSRDKDTSEAAADGAADMASDANSFSCSDSLDYEELFPDDDKDITKLGHLHPYGQKLHPEARVDPEVIRESILYVTVEPCVMCASILRQMGIKKVYFGAVNDKFGGTGGVFSIHANSLPVSADGKTASAHPQPKPIQYPDGGGSLGTSFPPGGGDGGNVEPGYEIEGGWGRDEAIGLLRRFYVQENGRAPIPRKKEGRAARLAAMMERDGLGSTLESTDEREHDDDYDEDDEVDMGVHEEDEDHEEDEEDEDEDGHCDDYGYEEHEQSGNVSDKENMHVDGSGGQAKMGAGGLGQNGGGVRLDGILGESEY